jgi:hypothetical protein
MTDSLEQDISWDADCRSVGQEITRLLRDSNIHYRVQTSQPLGPVLSQMNPVHTLLLQDIIIIIIIIIIYLFIYLFIYSSFAPHGA